MEESKAEEVIAVWRRGSNATYPDEVIYCLFCWYEFRSHSHVEGSGKKSACGGEYKWMTKADLESKKVSCTRCGEPITIEPRLTMSKVSG